MTARRFPASAERSGWYPGKFTGQRRVRTRASSTNVQLRGIAWLLAGLYLLEFVRLLYQTGFPAAGIGLSLSLLVAGDGLVTVHRGESEEETPTGVESD